MAGSPSPIKAWSYSRYADYTLCPFKFYCKVVLRLPDPGSPAMQRGNDIHKLAETFVSGPSRGTAKVQPKVPEELKYFADEFRQLRGLNAMVEQEWGFNSDWGYINRKGWFGDDVWFRAKADVFVPYEDFTADLIDHKTGKKYETNNEQVELFALAGFRRLPELQKITTRLWYLDLPTDNEVIMEFTAKDAELLQRDWTKRVQPMFNDRKFAPRPNSKCGWCAYSKAKGGPCKF